MWLLGNYLFKYLILRNESNSKERTRLHVFVFSIRQPISLFVGTWWKRVSLYPHWMVTGSPLGSDFLDYHVPSEVNLKPGFSVIVGCHPWVIWVETNQTGRKPRCKNDEAFIDESGILLSSIPRASIHVFKRRATDQSCYPYWHCLINGSMSLSHLHL